MKEIEETPVAQKKIKKAISPDELKSKTNMKKKVSKGLHLCLYHRGLSKTVGPFYDVSHFTLSSAAAPARGVHVCSISLRTCQSCQDTWAPGGCFPEISAEGM